MFAATALGVAPAAAQTGMVPLPPLDAQAGDFPGRLVSQPDSTGELPQPFFRPPRLDPGLSASPRQDLAPYAAPGEPDGQSSLALPPSEVQPLSPQESDLPPGARNGMFQRLIFTDGAIVAGGAHQESIDELDLRAILALPIPSRKAPLLITPGFGVSILDGPLWPDLPPVLYSAYAQFRWMCRWNPVLATDLAITPGVYSDFEQGTDEAIRLPGHGAVLWTWSPAWQALVGCAYTDRLENNILPIGGLIWTPNEDTKWEMVFPNPKLAHRFRWSEAWTPEVQDWVYLAGEFGGSAWAIGRADGTDDVVDYRDWRIVLGIERRRDGNRSHWFELGYLFSRRYLYESDGLEYEPDDTVMIRFGTMY
ncbi:MAG: hypothetical protein ACYC6Y_08375 [Thermoguttaceae bacterium]